MITQQQSIYAAYNLIQGMQKETSIDYNRQVKVLSKHFRFLDQHFIRLVFQFCEFQPIRTCKILEVIKDYQIPASFIKKLVDFPNDSDDLIKSTQNQFNKKYGHLKPQLIDLFEQKIEAKNQVIQIQAPSLNFFNFLPHDICAIIVSYLDPYSFSRIALTNKKLNYISKSEALNFYFKNLCLKIFENQTPRLPFQCRFFEIRDYVNHHPQYYGPNMRNAVNNNLRYYLWKSEPQSFKIQNSYYKSFGSYRNLFIQGPRIHFNGVYVCRHKYVKIGEKGYNHLITPIHVVYYYRYIRFFEDGSLLCHVTSTKCRKQQLAILLSRQNLQNFNPKNTNELKIGEYMQNKDTLYVKIVRQNTVFSYELQINSNENKISDELMVKQYVLQMIDENEIVQNLYTYKPYKERILFNYLRNEAIENDNFPKEKAISL